MLVSSILQWLGAVGGIGAFALAERGLWSVRERRYLLANAIGASLLCASAVLSGHWGYVVLEGCWAVIASRGSTVGPARPPAAEDTRRS